MNRILLSFILFLSIYTSRAQFAPAVGQPGSTAIGKDSSVFINWGDNAEIERGYVDISDKSKGQVIQGSIEQVYGKADNKTVSLGDSGVVVYKIDPPIINGESWDFAVFENSFDDTFLELATVEVSSDGENYFLFAPVSLTDVSRQTGTFGTLDATKIHNLAGKYRGGYGTPFDLDSLPDSDFLDKNNIKFIRITDVIGSINPDFSTLDTNGNPINDPFPTPFESGGFDLDALGIIHQKSLGIEVESIEYRLELFPSPVKNILNIKLDNCGACRFSILDVFGQTIATGIVLEKDILDVSKLRTGIYFVKIIDDSGKKMITKSFVK